MTNALSSQLKPFNGQQLQKNVGQKITESSVDLHFVMSNILGNQLSWYEGQTTESASEGGLAVNNIS